MKLLVTGFEPFGGQKTNASWQAVQKLPDRIGNIQLIKAEIPVVVYKSVDRVLELAEANDVDAIICVGEYGGSTKVRIELIGTNYLAMGIPDNEGNQTKSGLSYSDGPDAHFASIPVDEIATALSSHLPVELSLTAGSYVCNHVLYGVRHKQSRPSGFIHVPTTEEQGNKESMTSEKAAECIEGAIEQFGQRWVNKAANYKANWTSI